MSGPAPPQLNEVRAAAERLASVVLHTPLVPLRAPHDGDEILLKLETHQPAGCFKVRGVFNAVAGFSPEQRQRGLSTVSAGNTAKALAWCGQYFGVAARSIMPDTAPKTKVEAVIASGGEPILLPMEEVFAFLKEHRWEQEPYAFVHPWTERNVLIGHGTMALEIIADCPEVDTVFIPVGGGGLLGGVGPTLKALSAKTHIVAVEPTGCAALHASITAGRPASVTCKTICDGVAVPYITNEMYPLLRDVVDEVMLVDDASVQETIRLLIEKNHVVAEPSGALALAAALMMPPERRGTAVCLVTGGSIDSAMLASILIS